ncbi:MAG TPA: hypothetical protein VNG95_00450 [Gemmatimonadales bacterium]|nr:hypothetical protein [Gemmatimonadales bacterium]
MRTLIGWLALSVLVAAPAAAQDSQFGILGLGTPGRFESVRSRSTGGAFAAFDGTSPFIDASLIDLSRLTATAAQYDSYRTVNVGGKSTSLRGARFPLLNIAGPVSKTIVIGGGFSTYLARTYSVVTQDTVLIRGVNEPVMDRISSDGSVTDLRFAAAMQVVPRLAIGAGIHILSGSSDLVAERRFADSATYRNSSQTGQESYDGVGFSGSAIAVVGTGLRIAAFARSDSRLRSEIAGFQNASNDLPTTLGGAVRWDLNPGFKVAASVLHQNWSVSGPKAFNVTQWTLGTELGQHGMPLRFGVRGGQLPFGPGPGAPTEFAVSAGTGFQFSSGRGIIDLGLEHLRRTGGGMTESGWTALFGVSVRP